jgi:serine/threonine-protein kinase 24/25/MST4
LVYLNGKGIVHRDLKLPNILINEKNEIKIADFGLAKNINGIVGGINEKHLMTTIAGSPFIMAPEVVRRAFN